MTRLMIAVLLIVFTLSCAAGNPIKKVLLRQTDGCVCEKFSCGCCLYMDVPQIWLNDTACINFAYDADTYGISFTFIIDDKALINETISAKNPPPICFPIPVIEDFVDGCVHFTDLDISNTKFHGCAQLELRMWWVYVIAEVKLGCFDAYSNSTKLSDKIKKNQGPLFQNITVDEKLKYNSVPVQDMTPVNNVESITAIPNEKGNQNPTTINKIFSFIKGIFIKQDTQLNPTTGSGVPYNQSFDAYSNSTKLSDQVKKNEGPLFQNIAVDDKHKYNIVPMQDMIPVKDVENITALPNEEGNQNPTTINRFFTFIKGIFIKQDTQLNPTTGSGVPYKKSLEVNKSFETDKNSKKLSDQVKKSEGPFFQNIIVDDKHKYNIVPMQGIMPVNDVENITAFPNELENQNRTIFINQDTQFNQTTGSGVPYNQSLEGNQTVTAEELSMCMNKSNPISFSPYLLFIVLLQLVGAVNFCRLI